MLHCRDFLPRHGPPFPSVPAADEADSDRGKEESGTVTDYEVLLMLDPELPEERGNEIVARVREQVEGDKGTWDGQQPWGRRRLAYEIDHKTDGVYHLLTFSAEAATLDEVSRVLKITDGVMRHMATRRIAGSGKTPPPPPPPVPEAVPSREYSGERSNRRSNEDEEEE
jgi:small subunit ribosomal protein S6